MPVDVESFSQLQLIAASLPDDASADDCTTLVAGLQLANGAISIQHTQDTVDGMPLTTLTVNGDVIHTESFSTMTATVGTAGDADAISVAYTARPGAGGMESYSIRIGTSSMLRLTARAGEPHICVKGSLTASAF